MCASIYRGAKIFVFIADVEHFLRRNVKFVEERREYSTVWFFVLTHIDGLDIIEESARVQFEIVLSVVSMSPVRFVTSARR